MAYIWIKVPLKLRGEILPVKYTEAMLNAWRTDSYVYKNVERVRLTKKNVNFLITDV